MALPQTVLRTIMRLSYIGKGNILPITNKSSVIENLLMNREAKRGSHLQLRLNGEWIEVAIAPHKTLLEVLREDSDLTGTKHGCELGECGTCTVLIDGRSILSCLMLGLEAEGSRGYHIEGMAETRRCIRCRRHSRIWARRNADIARRDFLLAARELLDQKPQPSRDEIKEALSGNLCRCTGYIKIYEAVELAAARMRGEEMELPRESLYGFE